MAVAGVHDASASEPPVGRAEPTTASVVAVSKTRIGPSAPVAGVIRAASR